MIGDDDYFGGGDSSGLPQGGWDKRSTSEESATNGEQYTDYWWDELDKRTFVFDFGYPIEETTQATLKLNAFDLTDIDNVKGRQLFIEGYEVSGAFDNENLVHIGGIVTVNLIDSLGSSALNDILSDGIVTVDFINGKPSIKNYAIDYVSLSVMSDTTTFLIPDTGQTQSFTDTFGEDSDYLINPPSYTKLDAQGNELPDTGTEWVMVRDNVTGLIWEIKSDDGSLHHDKDNTYTWYDSNPETNGGYAGTSNVGTE